MSDNPPTDPLPEFYHIVGLWRSHALTPLTVIRGSLELLRRGFVGELIDEQRQLLDRTIRHTEDTIACWHHLSSYLMLHYSVEPATWQALMLATEVEQVVLRLKQTTPLDHVDVIMPSILPHIRGTDWLRLAMSNLIYPIDQYPQIHDVIPTIKIWSIDSDTIGVQITTGTLANLDPMEELDLTRLHPGSCLQTAALILQPQASRIRLTTAPQRTIFEFTLSVWSEA